MMRGMRMLAAACALAACGTTEGNRADDGGRAADSASAAAEAHAARPADPRGAAVGPATDDAAYSFRLHETETGTVDSIVVSRDGRVVQAIVPGENHVPPETGIDRISRIDLDFDGHADLAMLAELGMANSRSAYWRLDPRTGRFEPAGTRETLRSDSAAREHASFNRGGHAGRLWTASRWRWMDGALVEVRREEQEWLEDAGRYLRIVREHRGGALQETSRDTLDETELRAGPSWMEP